MADAPALDGAAIEKLPAKQAEAMRVIAGLAYTPSLLELVRRHGVSSSAVDALRRKGLLADADVAVRRHPDFASVPDGRLPSAIARQAFFLPAGHP